MESPGTLTLERFVALAKQLQDEPLCYADPILLPTSHFYELAIQSCAKEANNG